jgi:uncharacterized protein involved in exopolysaccharide biosynthesis
MTNRLRWLTYPLAILGANALLWSACIAYLRLAPVRYSSQFTLILPRADARVNTSISGVGQVDSGTNSIYSTELADPRADYKYVLQTDSFLSAVAEFLGISMSELGQPRVRLVENSSIFQIEIRGNSPEDAKRKAEAIHNQFFKAIDQLRAEEEIRRDQTYRKTLERTTGELKRTQEKLARFQKESGFNSPDQLNYLADSIEKVRQLKAEIDADQQAVSRNLSALSANLNLSPQQASQAFTLQSDQLFQTVLREYSEATANLAVMLKKWGENHPDVIRERSRQRAAAATLGQRGDLLLGQPIDQQLLTLLTVTPGTVGGRAGLYENVISLSAEQASLTSKSQQLDRTLQDFKTLYTQQIRNRETYDNLNRDLRIAEALFSSSVAQTNLLGQNAFIAYPLVQTLTSASLPSEPVSPKKQYALLGTAVGSLLLTTGLALLWLRAAQKHRDPSDPSNLERLEQQDYAADPGESGLKEFSPEAQQPKAP